MAFLKHGEKQFCFGFKIKVADLVLKILMARKK